MNRLQPVIAGTLALLLGGAVYLLVRPEGLLIGAWLGPAWPSHPAELSRFVQHLELPELFVYSLPGGLWVYWATCLQVAIWSERNGPGRRLWLAAPLLAGLGWELVQLTKTLPGTFDPLDLAAYLVGWMLGILWLKPEVYRYETALTVGARDRGDALAGLGHELHRRNPR